MSMMADPNASQHSARSTAPRPIRFRDRLLAEVVCRLEHDGEQPIDDPAALDCARAADRSDNGLIERRIIVRARSLRDVTQIWEAISVIHRALGWLTLLLIVLGTALGAVTVRSLLGHSPDARVNVFVALAGMLTLQTITLFIWLGAIAIIFTRRFGEPPSRGALPHFSLGSVVLSFSTWLTRRMHSGRYQLAAVEALSRAYGRGRVGRWMLSSITHGFWTSFNIGMLVALIALLGTRHYVFVWESTILSDAQYVQLTRAISALPDSLGFTTPTEQQIAVSRWTGQPLPPEAHAAREAWSGLLVGAVVLYGFAPRLLLLGLSIGLLRRSRAHYRLDLARPGFARLEPLLLTPKRRAVTTTGDADINQRSQSADHAALRAPPRPLGPPAIVGMEIERPQVGWPPPLNGIALSDLGLIETGEQLHAVIEQLTTAETEPGSIVIVCSLTTTPDRGIEHELRSIAQCVSRPPILVLTGGEALRRRQDVRAAFDHRIDDWHALAERAGFPPQHVLELDLDHLTSESAQQFTAALNRAMAESAPSGGEQPGLAPSAAAAGSAHLLKAAFESIEDHADTWLHQPAAHPSNEQQAALHREIAQHYSSRSAAWRSRFAPTMDALRDHPEKTLRDAAQRVHAMLPNRLRQSAKWAAAGAAAGAFGCIACALTLTPLAISALPAWSILGGSIAGIWRAAAGNTTATDAATTASAADATARGEEFLRAMRSAALFAVLLELQDNDESTITRILDRVFSPDEPESIAVISDVTRWLDDVRRRVVDARSAEGAA